jgi:carbon monoxide dehydrogenase subunit G
MEVKLNKRYSVAATPEQAWAVLGDIRATATCMPGAQITEQVDDTHFKGTVKSKIGPAVMSFGGEIEVQGIDPAAKSLQLMAKGADKSGSSAAMQLTAHLEAGDAAGTTTLVGVATITVSGKLAQFGSRLLVPVSDAMLAQFADNFRNAAAAVPLVAPADPGAVAAPEAAAASATAAPGASPTAPAAAAPVKELNALVLMWTVFRNWLAQLFGGKA